MITKKFLKPNATTKCLTPPVSSQKKIIDYGIIPLLRRFLLSDDYEKLSAIEAYDAQGL